jgi:hypothetical protein
MKKPTIVLGAIALAAVLALPTYAEAKPRKINCGWPHPDAACSVTPPVAPVTPSPVSPATATLSTQDVFSGLLGLQAEVVAGVQQADATQAAVLNPATSSAWEAAIHICLTGMPTIGAAGQPGYIPGNSGLIGWVQGLTAPSVAAIPPLPADPSPATLATHAQIIIDAAMFDVNNVVTQINAGGFPKYLEADCGGVLAHAQANINTIAGQVAGFDALLARYVMPVLAAHKHS